MGMGLEIIGRIGAKMFAMAVDSQGRAQVLAAAESEDRHINQISGKVWSVDIDGVVANAGTYIAYFENTDNVNYHLTDMRAHAMDAVTLIDIDEVSANTVGNGTAFTDAQITERNTGKTVAPEGNMALASSATGLTGLTKVGNLFHAGSLDVKSTHLSTSSNIIISPGGVIAIKILTANATNGMSITFSFVEVTHE